MPVRIVHDLTVPMRDRKRRQPGLVPAAARARTTLTPHEQQLSGDAIETFTAVVGGRAKLLATLSIADRDGSDKVIDCLLNDRYNSWSLRRICAHAGITVADLFASYKRALFAQAHIEAAHLITARLPPIVEDVMARALPQPRPCPRCTGLLPQATVCPVCQDTKQVFTDPGLARQKLALELGRLIEKGGGGVIVQQNAIATAALTSSSPGSLEQLQQAVGELLFSSGRRRAAAPVIDAEAPTRDVPQDDPRPDLPFPHREPPDDDADDDADDDVPLQT